VNDQRAPTSAANFSALRLHDLPDHVDDVGKLAKLVHLVDEQRRRSFVMLGFVFVAFPLGIVLTWGEIEALRLILGGGALLIASLFSVLERRRLRLEAYAAGLSDAGLDVMLRRYDAWDQYLRRTESVAREERLAKLTEAVHKPMFPP
jgi:hypothetical protein